MKTKLPKKDRTRKVPIHPVLKAWLNHWKTLWTEKYGREPKGTDWMLPNPNMKQPEAFVARVADMLRSDLEAAGLPTSYEDTYPFTFHALRRIVKVICGHAADGVIRMQIVSSWWMQTSMLTNSSWIVSTLRNRCQDVSRCLHERSNGSINSTSWTIQKLGGCS